MLKLIKTVVRVNASNLSDIIFIPGISFDGFSDLFIVWLFNLLIDEWANLTDDMKLTVDIDTLIRF